MASVYDQVYERSMRDPEAFWAAAAEDIYWDRRWDKVFDDSRKPYYRWFTGGRLNTCYNMLDLLSEIGTDLSTVVRTVGDVAATEEEAGDNVRVWVSTVSTRSGDGVVRKRQAERVAFDATTGEAVTCCGEFLETEKGKATPVRHEGLVFKFPFETEERAYSWWDDALREAVPWRTSCR